MKPLRLEFRMSAIAALALSPLLLSISAFDAHAQEARTLFVKSAVETEALNVVSLPIHRGLSNGRTVWYVVLDASTGAAAVQFGVNHSQKLANARGTVAVQKVKNTQGMIDFPASVDFSPQRVVQPGPTGFPPAAAQPGAVGEPGYSPLIEMPDGTILNAPQLANDSGQADGVTLDLKVGIVAYRETEGFSNGKKV